LKIIEEIQMNRKTIHNIAMFFGISVSFCGSVYATDSQISKFSVDLGYATLSPNDDNGEVSGPGLPPANSVDVKSASSIGMSVNYYQSNNISYQFYVAPAIDFDIHGAGSLAVLGHVSTVDVLLPTALVNYTFDQFGAVKPYLGVGINYTIFSAEKSTAVLEGALGGATEVQLKNSFGLAAQAGIRFNINKQWYVNANYLWIDVDSTAHINTSAVGTMRTVDLKIDPSVIYASVGYRF